MFNFLEIKKSITGIKSQVKTARDQIEKLKRRREEVQMAPPTKADVIAKLHGRIDAMASEYPGRVRKSLEPYIDGNFSVSDLDHHSLGFLLPSWANFTGPDNEPGRTIERFAYFLKKPLKDGIAAAVEQMDWPEGAMSEKDRVAELLKLDKEIAALDQEMEQLKTEAAQAGLFIDY